MRVPYPESPIAPPPDESAIPTGPKSRRVPNPNESPSVELVTLEPYRKGLRPSTASACRGEIDIPLSLTASVSDVGWRMWKGTHCAVVGGCDSVRGCDICLSHDQKKGAVGPAVVTGKGSSVRSTTTAATAAMA
eukprot:CAMPEP_0181211078 /NCGR_PEP_ID=MMETSP1096-20121128/23589_1 /TAXON_ID=156174 ORGANISM="Chrysochromulina ericina, Strain CCMP281" /NCGR_SAMPLE_ID=MMETSP1096 /ASSEMBLY_ACC=CAM_ASM_000453 /LENGTH=133 /DNA_ID=CAMNT_0023302445 /DNA_START=575 /DNA_END=974 /DNA_ORIENTATION=-